MKTSLVILVAMMFAAVSANFLSLRSEGKNRLRQPRPLNSTATGKLLQNLSTIPGFQTAAVVHDFPSDNSNYQTKIGAGSRFIRNADLTQTDIKSIMSVTTNSVKRGDVITVGNRKFEVTAQNSDEVILLGHVGSQVRYAVVDTCYSFRYWVEGTDFVALRKSARNYCDYRSLF